MAKTVENSPRISAKDVRTFGETSFITFERKSGKDSQIVGKELSGEDIRVGLVGETFTGLTTTVELPPERYLASAKIFGKTEENSQAPQYLGRAKAQSLGDGQYRLSLNGLTTEALKHGKVAVQFEYTNSSKKAKVKQRAEEDAAWAEWKAELDVEPNYELEDERLAIYTLFAKQALNEDPKVEMFDQPDLGLEHDYPGITTNLQQADADLDQYQADIARETLDIEPPDEKVVRLANEYTNTAVSDWRVARHLLMDATIHQPDQGPAFDLQQENPTAFAALKLRQTEMGALIAHTPDRLRNMTTLPTAVLKRGVSTTLSLAELGIPAENGVVPEISSIEFFKEARVDARFAKTAGGEKGVTFLASEKQAQTAEVIVIVTKQPRNPENLQGEYVFTAYELPIMIVNGVETAGQKLKQTEVLGRLYASHNLDHSSVITASVVAEKEIPRNIDIREYCPDLEAEIVSIHNVGTTISPELNLVDKAHRVTVTALNGEPATFYVVVKGKNKFGVEVKKIIAAEVSVN